MLISKIDNHTKINMQYIIRKLFHHCMASIIYIYMNPLKVLIKENKVIYQSINQLNSGWCHTVIKFQLHYLTVTLLNNSVELSSNLDKPVP